MNRLTLLTLTVLWSASVHSPCFALSIGTYDITKSFADHDLVAEVTIVASDVRLYQENGKDLTCGVSYRAIVNDRLKGESQSIIEFTQRIWTPDETRLDSSELKTGARYFIGFDEEPAHRDATYYVQHGPLDVTWGDSWLGPEAARCLATLPTLQGGVALEIHRDWMTVQRDGESVSTETDYILIQWTSWKPGDPELESLVSGARAQSSYVRTDRLNRSARSYLTRFGRHSPAELRRLAAEERRWAKAHLKHDPGEPIYYLEEIGRNGDYLFYENVILYDDFKRLVRKRLADASASSG